MKKLNLVVVDKTNFNPSIIIDNRVCKYTIDEKGNKKFEIQTDKNELDVEIFKWFEIERKHWIFTSFIFFFISFFGMFDIKYNDKPYDLKYKGKVILNEEENDVNVVLRPFKPNEKAFMFEGNCDVVDNETNKYFINDVVVNRRNKLKKVKKRIKLGVFGLAIIIGIVFLI